MKTNMKHEKNNIEMWMFAPVGSWFAVAELVVSERKLKYKLCMKESYRKLNDFPIWHQF